MPHERRLNTLGPIAFVLRVSAIYEYGLHFKDFTLKCS